MRTSFVLAALALLAGFGAAERALAAFDCGPPVVRRGGPALGDGTFNRITALALNDAGRLAFVADRMKRGNPGVFAADPDGTLTAIARRGGSAPDGGIFGARFAGPSIDATGRVVFGAITIGPTGLANGIFRGAGGALEVIARQGDPAPGCGGQLGTFGTPSTDAAGRVVFRAALVNATVPSGLFAVSAGGIAALVCAETDTLLQDGTEVEFETFGNPVADAAGGVAFVANVETVIWGTDAYTDAVFRIEEATGAIVEVMRLGDPVPGVPDSFFYLLFDPAGIGAAATSFRAFITGDVYQGIFVRPHGGLLTTVLRRGDSVPGTSVRLKRFSTPAMGTSGALVVRADTLGGARPRHVQLFVSPAGAVEAIAADGDAAPVPEAGVVFKNFRTPVVNGTGAVAFGAKLSGLSAAGDAVFVCAHH